MLSKELKSLVKISGGKIVISEGDTDSSYVVMNLTDYLKEKRSDNISVESKNKKEVNKKEEDNLFSEGRDRVRSSLRNILNKRDGVNEKDGLTKISELDKIDAEISEAYREEKERELDEIIKAEQEEFKYDYLFR